MSKKSKPKKNKTTKPAKETKAADKPATDAKAEKPTKADKKPEDTKTVVKAITRTLPCKLSEKEMAKLAEDLEANMSKIESIEAQKKTADDGFKKDISMLEEVTTVLRNRIKTKAEEREVKCEEETDYRMGEVRVKRLDTGEIFQKRTMTKDEVQMPLTTQKAGKLIALDGGKAKDDKKAAPTERKKPMPNDVIDVETIAGWKRGKVLPSSGSVLDVDVGDGKIEHAPVDGQTWRWPDEVGENSAPVVEKAEPLTAKLGDVAAAHEKNKADAEKAEQQAEEDAGGHPEVERLLKNRSKGEPAEQTKKLPEIGDRIAVRGYDGWQEGKVSKIDDVTMMVDIGDDEIIQVAVSDLGDEWQWPEALNAQGKAKKRSKSNPNGVDTSVPPDQSF
jgi:hypothetical protein